MGRLEGRVAVVTGAGRGLGRAHALALAAEGARLVVNDLGGDVHGVGTDLTPAQEVAHAIEAAGGEAVVSGHDVADWEQAREMVELAVSRFGDLHVIVNNAGILRDRTLANLEEAEWDAVMRVHLKGHAATTHHAMAHWRDRFKAGDTVKASLIHTTSIAGFAGNFGQAAYSAAKLGIVALSRVAALEGQRYGVRSNAVSPSARTRLDPSMKPVEGEPFDAFEPANVSPIVAWLAAADCPATAQVFQMYGNRLKVLTMATVTHDLRTQGRWAFESIGRALQGRLVEPFGLTYYVEELEDLL